MRPTLTLVLACSLALGAIAGCTDPDIAGYGPATRSKHSSATSTSDDEVDTTPTEDKVKSKTTTAPSATTTPAPTAPPAPPPIDPFGGAGSFELLSPSTETEDHHLGETNAGMDCMTCHTGSGAPRFVVGGTIRRSKSGAEGAPGVEVRIVDPKGNEVALTGTDSAGNFWLESTIAIPPGSRVGIRDGSGNAKMSGAIGIGSCNQSGCHDRNRPIFLGN